MATAGILVAVLGGLCVPAAATTRPAATDIVGEWSPRPPLRQARGGLSVVTVGGQILAIGGFAFDGEGGFRVFDIVEARRVGGSGVWYDLAPMLTARTNFGTATLHGKVYVAGGDGADDELRSVEVYDPAANRWMRGPSLPRPRTGTVVLDPRHGTWREIAPMPTARERLRLVAAGGYLYAVGGSGVTGRSLTTVERYDRRTNSWRTVRPMIEARTVPCVIETIVGKRRLLDVLLPMPWGRRAAPTTPGAPSSRSAAQRTSTSSSDS